MIPKRTLDFQGSDDKVLSMYAHGTSMRDIQNFVLETYGTDVGSELASTVTERVLDALKATQNCAPEKV